MYGKIAEHLSRSFEEGALTKAILVNAPGHSTSGRVDNELVRSKIAHELGLSHRPTGDIAPCPLCGGVHPVLDDNYDSSKDIKEMMEAVTFMTREEYAATLAPGDFEKEEFH